MTAPQSRTAGQTLFLSRAEHDELLTRNQRLLEQLFNTAASRKWSLAGVLFDGLPQSTIDRVLDAMVTT